MSSSSTYLHPDFGSNTGGYPYGIPFAVVTSRHRIVYLAFQYASESYRGPYPFGPNTPIEGGQNAGGDRFTADATSAAYLWPARHQAGSGSMATLPPMGARFRLKASFPVARFCGDSQPYCRDAKAVLVEMQNFGLILADNGSNWYFQGSAYPQWPDALVSLLKGIPADALQAVNESCLMVNSDSGAAKAKAGCPIG
jgi:hypothetical protein